jgi:hypothetical protein
MAFYQQFKTLTLIDNFDLSKIVFDKPRDEEVGNNKHIKGKRIKIGYLNNGKVTELIIPTEKLFAYKGVRATKPFGKEDSDEIIGYNLPIALYSRTSDDGRDRKFVEIFRQIINASKDHVVSVKKQINQAHLEKVMLYRWDNMLYEKKNSENEPANEFGPTLFAKLMYSQAKGTIATKLVDKKGKPLQLEDVLSKPANVIACVKFESIYINSNGPTLQVKLTEAIIDVKDDQASENLLLKSFLSANDDDEELDQEMDLLKVDVAAPVVVEAFEHEEVVAAEETTSEIEESEHEHEEPEHEEPEPEPEPKKPVKKITKKK